MLGVSLWQPVPYEEAELLTEEIASDPTSRLHRALIRVREQAKVPVVTDAEKEAGAAMLAKLSGIVS